MAQLDEPEFAYVVKPYELAALNHLPAHHPQPVRVEWINRATDQKLKQSNVEVLLRTLFNDVASPSVVRLHKEAGLRVVFRSEADRLNFGRLFSEALANEQEVKGQQVTAIFDNRDRAEAVVSELKRAGLPDVAISLLWRASKFMDPDIEWSKGHSKLSIANATAGGGIAGAVLGIAILSIPGVGPVAAAGALASSAYASVAAVSASIGATGGAIARMLTDHDVDGVSAALYEQQIERGKVFLSVDLQLAQCDQEVVRQIMREGGGRNLISS